MDYEPNAFTPISNTSDSDSWTDFLRDTIDGATEILRGRTSGSTPSVWGNNNGNVPTQTGSSGLFGLLLIAAIIFVVMD